MTCAVGRVVRGGRPGNLLKRKHLIGTGKSQVTLVVGRGQSKAEGTAKWSQDEVESA